MLTDRSQKHQSLPNLPLKGDLGLVHVTSFQYILLLRVVCLTVFSEINGKKKQMNEE